MRGRLGFAVALSIVAVVTVAGTAAADDGAGETFVEMQIGDAPAPTLGYTIEADAAIPADRGRTVETFEVPDRFEEFYLYVTEKHTDTTTRVEVWERFTAKAPSGAQVEVGGHTGGTGFAVTHCFPPSVSCTDEQHPGTDPSYVHPTEDGTYELRLSGVVTGTYTITGYGLGG